MRIKIESPRAMIQSIGGLIKKLHAESAAFEQKIISLRNGTVGSHLTPNEKSAEIKLLIDATAEVTSLISEFIPYSDLPVEFRGEDRNEPEPVVWLRYQGAKIAAVEPVWSLSATS